ncbi:MAG: hypothetical protein AAF610_14335, partial [Pseudomonadota bacterium]
RNVHVRAHIFLTTNTILSHRKFRSAHEQKKFNGTLTKHLQALIQQKPKIGFVENAFPILLFLTPDQKVGGGVFMLLSAFLRRPIA